MLLLVVLMRDHFWQLSPMVPQIPSDLGGGRDPQAQAPPRGLLSFTSRQMGLCVQGLVFRALVGKEWAVREVDREAVIHRWLTFAVAWASLEWQRNFLAERKSSSWPLFLSV